MKKLKIERKSRKYSTFEIFNMLISILVIAFIASTILAIILKGIPSIEEAIRSDEVRFAIRLSLLTASTSTLLCIFLAIPTAYTLVRTSMPFIRFAQIILELPLSMPYLVLGLGLLIIFSTDAGKALRDMGFRVVFDKNGIIIAQTVVNLPYAIRLIKTAFLEIDERLEYIAGILGASRWKRFPIHRASPVKKRNDQRVYSGMVKGPWRIWSDFDVGWSNQNEDRNLAYQHLFKYGNRGSKCGDGFRNDYSIDLFHLPLYNKSARNK